MRRRALLASGVAAMAACRRGASASLLNVSYDPTRELYQALNAVFTEAWKKRSGAALSIQQSHGGSGKQARAVIDGLPADVVTLALALDIDAIAERSGRVAKDWQKRLPHNSSPYTSTIVLVVRKGNPRGIRTFRDLAQPGIGVITPNPKTGGGARWNYLAAWGAELRDHGDEARAREVVGQIYKNVLVLDSGARGSTTTFAQRGLGDVLVSWENEALLLVEQLGRDKFEVVVPPASILAEPPVALVDRTVDERGTRAAAQAYLEFLYTEEAQAIAARYHYRPRHEGVARAHAQQFANTQLFTIDEVFGGWAKAQKTHFDDGGVYDALYAATRAR